MLHGRLIGGLAARWAEAEIADPDFQPARLTIDLFKAVPLEPVTAEVARTRDGGRVKSVELSIRVGGVEAARSSVLFLLRSEAPENPVHPSQPWSDVLPDELEPPPPGVGAGFDLRFVPGKGFGTAGVRRAWAREDRPLVGDEDLTPFQRAGLVGDFANPLGNSSEGGIDYINADFTLYLARLPDGEWLGLETTEHVDADGVAVAACVVHDLTGPLGTTTVAAVRNPRMVPASAGLISDQG